jgi:uncharacterized membrane protein
MSIQPPQRPRYQPEETELIRAGTGMAKAWTWLVGLNIFVLLLIIGVILATIACVVGFCVLTLVALGQVVPPTYP